MEATFKQGEKVSVYRTHEFKRNDIAVFKRLENNIPGSGFNADGSTDKQWYKFMYRIIAVSGDTLQIINNRVFINGKPAAEPPGVQLLYFIYALQQVDELNPKEEDNFQLYGLQEKRNDTFIYKVPLTQERAAELARKKPVVAKVEEYFMDTNIESTTSLAHNATSDHWTASNYGPVIIPRPGETLRVTNDNLTLYQNIEGIQPGEYPLKETLYFLMGDNRFMAQDSRYIGFIPQSAMHGVVRQ